MITFLTFFVNLSRKSNKIPYNYQIIQIHAGLRGAIAYSLSVSFPSHNRPTIVAYIYYIFIIIFYSATMWIILFTLFLQGCSTYDMLKLMKIPLGVEYVKPPEMKQEHDLSELLDAYTPESWKKFYRYRIYPIFHKSEDDDIASRRKSLLAEDIDDEVVYK